MNTSEQQRNSTQPKIAFSIEEVAQQIGLSRTSIYSEINSGSLKSTKIGARRFITAVQRDAWLAHKAELSQAS